jgi:hypothetical protein
MLAHNVFFSLKDSSDSAVQTLIRACRIYLVSHPGIVFFACGMRQKELNRPVNDLDFDVSLHIIFDSKVAHDAYQDAPLHHTFVEENKDSWAKVRVFDSEVTIE